jgi:hypothetical protein
MLDSCHKKKKKKKKKKKQSNQFLVIVNGSSLQALFTLYNVHQEHNRTIIDFD